jgi:hypothetical protein
MNRKSFRYKLGYATILMFTSAWSLMIAVGVVHHEWIVQCPTIGFGWALLLTLFIRSIFAGLMVTVSEDWT